MTEQRQFDLTDLDGSAWVSLAGGPFEMGSRTGRDDARPVREVSLSSFRLSRYLVTNGQLQDSSRVGLSGSCSLSTGALTWSATLTGGMETNCPSTLGAVEVIDGDRRISISVGSASELRP